MHILPLKCLSFYGKNVIIVIRKPISLYWLITNLAAFYYVQIIKCFFMVYDNISIMLEIYSEINLILYDRENITSSSKVSVLQTILYSLMHPDHKNCRA